MTKNQLKKNHLNLFKKKKLIKNHVQLNPIKEKNKKSKTEEECTYRVQNWI